MDGLSLRLDPPRHGWLTVTLGRTDAEAAAKEGMLGLERVVVASDVPCDSLAMLANAAAALCDGVSEASVE